MFDEVVMALQGEMICCSLLALTCNRLICVKKFFKSLNPNTVFSFVRLFLFTLCTYDLLSWFRARYSLLMTLK